MARRLGEQISTRSRGWRLPGLFPVIQRELSIYSVRNLNFAARNAASGKDGPFYLSHLGHMADEHKLLPAKDLPGPRTLTRLGRLSSSALCWSPWGRTSPASTCSLLGRVVFPRQQRFSL